MNGQLFVTLCVAGVLICGNIIGYVVEEIRLKQQGKLSKPYDVAFDKMRANGHAREANLFHTLYWSMLGIHSRGRRYMRQHYAESAIARIDKIDSRYVPFWLGGTLTSPEELARVAGHVVSQEREEERQRKDLAEHHESVRRRRQERWQQLREEFEELKKTPIFRKWVLAQWLAQSGSCAWCSIPIKKWPSYGTEVDHVTPLSYRVQHQGDNSYENLVLSCSECNQNKGDEEGCELPEWIKPNAFIQERQEEEAIARRKAKQMREIKRQKAWKKYNKRQEDLRKNGYIRCPKCESDEVRHIIYGGLEIRVEDGFPPIESSVAKYTQLEMWRCSQNPDFQFYCKSCGYGWNNSNEDN